jgi:hypothetical protein
MSDFWRPLFPGVVIFITPANVTGYIYFFGNHPSEARHQRSCCGAEEFQAE